MAKRITLPQAIARYARPAPARPRPTYPSTNIDWKNYPRPPGWVPVEGMPWMSVYRPGAAGDASRLESLRAREKVLLESGKLGRDPETNHQYRKLQEQILAIDTTPAPTAEIKSSPSEYDSLLLKEMEAQPASSRVDYAKQVRAEVYANKDDPYWKPDDPRHEGQRRVVNRALEIIHTENE